MERAIQKICCFAAAAFAILVRTAAVADEPPGSTKLLQSCIANTAYCYAAILVEWKSNEQLRTAGICSFDIPVDVQLPALRDIVVDYLKNHPEFDDVDPSSNVRVALSQAYPCSDPAAGASPNP
jgi:hypothetical protein